MPLEDSFESWVWSRAAKKDGAAIIYDTVLKGGATSAFALEIGADGAVREGKGAARGGDAHDLRRMKRHMRAAADFRVVSLLEDSPFYARTLLRVRTEEGRPMPFTRACRWRGSGTRWCS